MKLSLATAVATLAGFAWAQSTVQSKPFKLVISSDDKSLNGKSFSACHTGAAIESLCVYDTGDSFYFNTTKGDAAAAKGLTPPGILNWPLPLRAPARGSTSATLTSVDPGSVSEPMSFFYEPSTNVALPLFQPSETSQSVAFTNDKKGGALRIVSYLDDTTTKPSSGQSPRALNRWYVCATNYLGYSYTTLNWVLGSGKPQNPTCKKVDVTRKFV